MSFIKERVSYLKGLAEGMKIDESVNEGKLLKAIIEVLDDVALAVEDIEDVQEQLEEQVDNIDEDLAEFERFLFDGEEDDDDFIAQIECPHCNEIFELTEDMISCEGDSFDCPHCNEEIAFEWDCDCEECNHEEVSKQ